jgi:hypothetical protein
MVSSNMLKERSASQAAKNNHYTASTEREILLWIAQRCDFTLNVKETIKEAYKSVQFLIFTLILPNSVPELFPVSQPLSFRRTSTTRWIGCLSTASP